MAGGVRCRLGFAVCLALLNLPLSTGSGAATASLRGKVTKPEHAVCGRVGWHNQKNKIVHGEDSKQCAWKWQVSLRAMINGTAQHFCGGTLISEKFVLTAAHCTAFLNDCKMAKMQVVAGGWYQNETSRDSSAVVRGVRRVIVHPSFNTGSRFNMDIGLLELDAPVAFDDCVGSVCLPSKSFPGEGTTCEVTGWGTLNPQGALPSVLQQGELRTINSEICAQQYAKDNQTITNDMICATGSTVQGVTDACQGDSGGPLVCLEGERFVIAGVISWGHGCGDANFPGVYARVASGLDWIQDMLSGRIKLPEEPKSADLDFKGQMWTVVSGRCSIDEEGCVRSPGYPDKYGEREKCRIAVDTSAAMPIRVDHFATEEPYDHLEVNCEPYSGKKGPHGIVPNSDIFWLADGSMQDKGWRLCPETP